MGKAGERLIYLVRAARGGKSKSGGTNTMGGGGSLEADHKFPIVNYELFLRKIKMRSRLKKRERERRKEEEEGYLGTEIPQPSPGPAHFSDDSFLFLTKTWQLNRAP